MRFQSEITVIILFFISSSLLASHGRLLPISDQGSKSSRTQTYIVHVRRPHDSNYLSSEHLESYHKSFLPNTTLDSGNPRLVYSYRKAISGFAARLTAEEVRAMGSADGFLHAHVERRHPLLTTYTPTFLGLDRRDGIWYNNGYGKGMIIGVLDTGVDPTHPSFSDQGMPPPPRRWRGGCDSNACNNKLIGSRAFQGGVPAPVGRDSTGHGTHVASIAAGSFVDGANVLGNANGTSVGMAPKAHLAIYQVCSKGGCDDSDILAGIDQAIHDGVDVMSISIGSSLESSQEAGGYNAGLTAQNFYEDSIAVGSFSAARYRILTVAAAGNDGPKESTVTNDAPWLLTVGASSTDRRIRAIVRLGNGRRLKGETAYQPSSFDPTLLPMVFPGYEGQGGQKGCRDDSFDDIDVKGKIVLCETGYEVTNIEKGEFVKRAGGAAMIILNQKEQGFTTLSEAHVLPAAHVSFSNAVKITSYFSSTDSTPEAAIIFKGTEFGAHPSPAVASFSSRGPSRINGGILKPDIIGPGLNILGAWPANVEPDFVGSSASTFNILSGTSMAAPHLAGIAALIKSAHPNWSPAAIKSSIMTTASSLDRDGKPIADESNDIAGLFATGAGQVNSSKADDPGLVYNFHSHHYDHYLCGLGYTDEQISVIIQRQIQCSKVRETSPEDLNYPSISLSLGLPSRKTIRRRVKNVGDANSVYFAKIEAPDGVSVEVSPNRLQFTKRYEKKHFRIVLTANVATLSRGQVSEGHLSWVSSKYVVRSPISITLT